MTLWLKAVLFALSVICVSGDALYNSASCRYVDWSCERSNCTFSIQTPCRCDLDCEIYKDCCYQKNTCKSSTKPEKLPKFECFSPVPRPSWTLGMPINLDPLHWYYMWMVTDCPEGWLDNENEQIRSLRQNIQDKCRNEDLPVSDKATGFDYRNRYCAICNGIENLVLWGYNYTCTEPLFTLANTTENFELTQELIDENCLFVNYTRPYFTIGESDVVSHERPCYPTQPRQCLKHKELEGKLQTKIPLENYEFIVKDCVEAPIQALVDGPELQPDEQPYANPYCALCDGNPMKDIKCFPIGFSGGGTSGFVFSLFLDINEQGQLLATSDTLMTVKVFNCPKNQVYDPMLKECRSTIILDCYNTTQTSVFRLDEESCKDIQLGCNGSLIALDNKTNTFYYNDESSVIFEDEVLDVEFRIDNDLPVVCIDFTMNGSRLINETRRVYMYPIGHYILTYAGCSLSVIGCLLVLITNALFKELRSLPTKLLMNLALAILVTNLLIILGSPVTAAFPDNEALCVITAIFLHFFCLSQFSWMSLMSVEIVHSFYSAHKMRPKDHFPRHRKLLAFYIITGWTIPLLITLITIIVNFSTDSNLVSYGVTADGTVGRCWINHSESLIAAFIVPIAVALTFNLVAFLIVCGLLIQARCLETKLKGNKFPYFRASTAIFTVSGITWMCGFIGLLSQANWAWYLFTLLNTTQGLMIFLAFLCTKKVGRLYLNLILRRRAGNNHRQASQRVLLRGVSNHQL